jgi:hypothetical protein
LAFSARRFAAKQIRSAAVAGTMALSNLAFIGCKYVEAVASFFEAQF